jgi:hypothetical protein
MSREELVRIDEQGVVHPVGKTASARLRTKKGEFRVMPGPAHVLVLRYVGSDGRRDDDDGAVIRIAGEITAPGALCDVVAMVAQAGYSGELMVGSEGVTRSAFFERGNILGVQTTSRSELIGEVMYRLGALSREQIDLVIRNQEGMRFGEAAVFHRFLSRERLFEMMGHQTEEVVHAMLRVDDGMFYFLDRYEPSRLAFRHQLSTENLLMEGVRRMDESKYFRERIPSEHHVPVPVHGRTDPPADLARVYGACDGKRSVLDVGRACGLGEFDVMHAIFRLVQAGLVRISPPAPTGIEAIVSIFNEVIASVFQVAAKAGKADLLAEQLAAFATSTGVYTALFAGAGPAPDGTVNDERIAANVRRLAGESAESTLMQWLHEYLTFALFDLGGQLPKADESELSKVLCDRVAMLAPKA